MKNQNSFKDRGMESNKLYNFKVFLGILKLTKGQPWMADKPDLVLL